MPAAAAVKELLTAWTQRGEDMLEVGRRSRERPERHRVERPATHSQQPDTHDPARHLKRAAGDVLMRDTVGGQMQERPKK